MSTRQHIVRIALLLLLASVLQAWMLYRNKLPSQDGVRFIRIASEFRHQTFADTLKRSVQHPLYPMLIYAYHQTLGKLSGDSAVSWLVSAQRAAALATVLLVIPMYLAGLRLTEPTIAAGATAIFTLLPIMTRIGADALSESTYLLCFLIAFWGAVEFLYIGRSWWLLLAGIGSGMAYLARPEGLVLPVALMASLVGSQIRPIWRLPWRSVATGLALLVVGTMLCVAPYVLITGRLTPKNSLNFILRRLVPPPPEIAAKLGVPEAQLSTQGKVITSPPEPVPLPALPSGELDFTHKHSAPWAHFQGYLPALKEFSRELIEALHYVFAVLALLGMRRRRLQPTNVLAGILAVLFALAILQFASRAGYISTRHVITIVCLATYSAAEGGWLLAGAIAQWHVRRCAQQSASPEPATGGFPGSMVVNQVKFRWQPRFAGVLMVLGAAVCVPRSWAPLHESRVGHLQAGRWLAEHCAPDTLVLDTRGWAALFSDLQAYNYHGAREAFADPRLDYVIVEREELLAATARAETLQHLLRIGGEEVVQFRSDAEPENAVIIYRWYPDRLVARQRESQLR